MLSSSPLVPFYTLCAPVGLVTTIGLAVIAAAVMVVVLHWLKQPALLAYILAGLLLGFFAHSAVRESAQAMENVSHLGLVLLLFIIGLELNLGGILRLGPRVATALLLQAPIAIAAVWGLQWLLHLVGVQALGLGSGRASWFYFAVAASLSSTAVVVRLLDEKFDLDSQAGKATVLTLIAQDIWAVLALSYVSTTGTAGAWSAVLMVVYALLVGAALVLFARHVLARVMLSLVKAPDLIAMVALGWCFACAAAMSYVGLSAEMGALIAGLTLGSLPIATEVLAKVSSLRDFFMALFFIALGISLPPPTASVMAGAAVLAIIALAARLFLFMPTLMAARMGPIVSAATAINLGQLSEFALLLTPIGRSKGALTTDEAATISYAMMLSVLLASYAIKSNYRVAAGFARLLRRSAPTAAPRAASTEDGRGAEIVMLGFFLNAEAFVERLKQEQPELLPKILVIDFNLKNHPRIAALGLRVAYGDISNPDTLRHFGADKARVVISTISDTFLRNTCNEKLLDELRLLNPEVAFIGTANSAGSATQMVERGAFACIAPPEQAAPRYAEAVIKALARSEARELGAQESSA